MWHVLTEAIPAGVIEAYDDHGRNLSIANQTVGGFVDLPLHARKRGRRLEKILPIVEVQNGIAPCRIFAVVVSGRKPDAQESCVPEETTAELMQAQITRRRLHANNAGSDAGTADFSFLGFCHPGKGAFLEYNGGPLHAPALRSFTIAARTVIRKIITCEATHKMHQVFSS